MPLRMKVPYTDRERKDNKCYDPYMRILWRAYVMCVNRTADFDYDDMAYIPIRRGLGWPEPRPRAFLFYPCFFILANSGY